MRNPSCTLERLVERSPCDEPTCSNDCQSVYDSREGIGLKPIIGELIHILHLFAADGADKLAGLGNARAPPVPEHKRKAAVSVSAGVASSAKAYNPAGGKVAIGGSFGAFHAFA